MSDIQAGIFVSVFTLDRNFQVRAQHANAIDAAVSRWVDSGGTRDTLLDLETTEGMELRLLASAIYAWILSTPETRRRLYQLDKAYHEERRAFRAEAGLAPDEDDW